MASLLVYLYAFVEVLVDWNGGTYYTSTVPVPVKARPHGYVPCRAGMQDLMEPHAPILGLCQSRG